MTTKTFAALCRAVRPALLALPFVLSRAILPVALLWPAAAADVAHAQGAPASPGLPHLEHLGEATQLVVDGKPFLMLGGELHNSSSSSVDYMQAVWPRLEAMHLNTVVLPVAWETIEPQEGTFTFTNVDGLLQGARAHHLKLVILWFGAWKNTYSSYVPLWVKQDTTRFPRVETSEGRLTERLSPFSRNVATADQRAFAALMRHLRETDSHDHTALMVQVENEVGVIPQSRDHSAVAEKAFAGPVPQALLTYLQSHRTALNPELRSAWEEHGAKQAGSWKEVFGPDPLTDDLFMAWHYATYTEGVTRAGKREYPLPMYANAALIRPNYAPGQYNSGGPLPHSLDVWRAGAPALDLFSPDIYFNEFIQWATAYTANGNPLFIPETQGGATGAANSLYAFGALSAMGFSPFGVDDEGNTPLDLVGITNPAQPPDNRALGAMYNVLTELSPQILQGEQQGSLAATLIESEAQRGARLRVGPYTANVTRAGNSSARVGVLFLQQGPDEWLVVGSGDAQISFSTDQAGPPQVGIGSIDEMFFRGGTWVAGRRMNGDESGQGQVLRLHPGDTAAGRIYRLRLYRYP